MAGRRGVVGLGLVAMVAGCGPVRQDAVSLGAGESGQASDQAPVAVVNPMLPFEMMIGGRWKMTAQSGTSMFDTWHWGPGRRSLRVMTDGQSADGRPWRSVSVYYWHPGLTEIRTLGLQPVFRGINEGSITFDGQRAEGFSQLHQTGGTREMGLRWTFEGKDKYRDELLENGPEGYYVMNKWERFRVGVADAAGGGVSEGKDARTALGAGEGVLDARAGATPGLSALMEPFGTLLGRRRERTWEFAAVGQHAGAPRSRTTFEYVPYADAIYGRVDEISTSGAASHSMDVYLYHHTSARVLRCLAVGVDGRGEAVVYEGVVKKGDGEDLVLELRSSGAEGDKRIHMRVEFDGAGGARLLGWRSDGERLEQIVDARYSGAN
jgi:hypothetical protein